jgi:cell division protein ZapE
MMGPIERYEAAINAGDIVRDEAQLDAIQHLQALFDELIKPPAVQGFFSAWFRKKQPRVITGLYFWGGVGRGKTFLMDVFYDSLPFENKSRMHFHRFMRAVHLQLKDLQGQKDPLELVADRFADEFRILCFDEFFVSDITDAMILAGLLEKLFRRGVVLVATSNVEPSHLYENGLQRRQFLPAIALIEKYTKILNVDGGVDYRLRVLESAEIYHSPLDAQADEGLARSFSALCPDEGKDQVDLEIEGRIIEARRCGDGVAWFEFSSLCDGPRSQNDYIELAHIFQSILIGNVPQFDAQKENQARRFISLVDEFYDRNVKLILSAETPILELYRGERLNFEFQRTVSRLQEMQSHDYLAREHKP